jgi:ClpP class serine protease
MVIEDTISTGPYKLWGSPRDTTLREIEMIKQGFFQAVKLGRGTRLQIGPEVLLRGQIWPAGEALRLGLIDRLGSASDALQQAAGMAHIWHYAAVDLHAELAAQDAYAKASTAPAGFFLQTSEGVQLPYPSVPGLYMLYMPSMPSVQK